MDVCVYKMAWYFFLCTEFKILKRHDFFEET